MSCLAIHSQGVGKQYRIGKAERYRTLRDTLAGWWRLPGRLFSRHSPDHRPATFWALRDVTFDIHPGEVVGLIGRNGAGKSTLLKVLSRITEPTTGLVDICGRVGSLLEVGTGFHPELTGRENVFLSGAILGMKRVEIHSKFDEIVSFAEVEQFIDTPVKHYSSGMYLRLAFGVAAHLEPEILLVDEVLAVGDVRFQRKCMDKMQDVGRLGRTVIFVSHNMPAITRLCQRAILLDEGTIVADGGSAEVVGRYLNTGLGTSSSREWADSRKCPGSDAVKLRGVRVRAEDGSIVDTIDIRQTVGIELEFDVLEPGHILLPHYSVHTGQGHFAFVGLDQDPSWRGRPRPVGRYRSTGWIPGNLLTEGIMLIGPGMRALTPDVVHFYEREAVSFQVVDCAGGDTARGDYPGGIPGATRPLLRWETEYEPLNAHRGGDLPAA